MIDDAAPTPVRPAEHCADHHRSAAPPAGGIRRRPVPPHAGAGPAGARGRPLRSDLRRQPGVRAGPLQPAHRTPAASLRRPGDEPPEQRQTPARHHRLGVDAALGQCLRAAGYDTVYGGKLHVEGFPAFTPEVERRFGFRCLTGDSREELALCSRDFLLLRGREPARARQPFFLWASFINPHDICRVLRRDADHPSFEPATLEECPPLPENFAPTRAEPRWIEPLPRRHARRRVDLGAGPEPALRP